MDSDRHSDADLNEQPDGNGDLYAHSHTNDHKHADANPNPLCRLHPTALPARTGPLLPRRVPLGMWNAMRLRRGLRQLWPSYSR